jgi:predicted 3-demethylubiquinone-9 3-methyltransferase (glyoxalase superfamily)
VDHYWEKLAAGGEYSQCGWLKDKFGLSWQVVPAKMVEWMSDPMKAAKVMEAVFTMQKLDLAKLEAAAKWQGLCE